MTLPDEENPASLSQLENFLNFLVDLQNSSQTEESQENFSSPNETTIDQKQINDLTPKADCPEKQLQVSSVSECESSVLIQSQLAEDLKKTTTPLPLLKENSPPDDSFIELSKIANLLTQPQLSEETLEQQDKELISRTEPPLQQSIKSSALADVETKKLALAQQRIDDSVNYIKETMNQLALSPGVGNTRSESTQKSTVDLQKSDVEGDDALERLQRLLVSPDLLQSRDKLEVLKDKFETLEHQIYNPTKLINLILPLISDILSIKIAEAREEMAQIIAPIVDEMIQAKTKEDKPAISAALAPVLPDAITQQVLQSPGEFGKAIAPEISSAIKEQIDLERDSMVDALYPVIGSTISKYMAEAIAAINQKVENTLSPEGISRKIRARMQGVSEAELIFKEAMPFSVKAIFLIHKASGLVISEVQPFGKQHLESEMVAGMLTAIRSFVNDCIAQSGEVSELDRIDYGNCEIILEVAGYCYLAVVTQGDAPKPFLDKMRGALATIVQRHGKSIELFDGDPANVPKAVHQLLKSIVEVSELVWKPKRKVPLALFLLSTAILSGILIPWGLHNHQNKINRRVEEKTSLALATDPELAVYRLQVDADRETLKLSGKLPNNYLVEKAEQVAQMSAPKSQIKNEIISVEIPPDPVIVAGEVERVTGILNQTERVAIWATYNQGKVTVKGSIVQITDAQKITEALAKIPGVQSVTNTVQLQPLALASRIYFDLNSAKLKSSELSKINQLKAFLNDYPNQNLRLIGYSDRTGNMLENQSLALERAKTVGEILVRQGIDPRRLQVAGTTKPPTDVYPDESPQFSRFVEFEAIAR
ncbi:MAG TPA: hypothetical protein DCY91_14395 [Cyanobacteria bacterium UBA11370]|nr:hypothetical protein [Cyanobacteria bacterium UBA11370]HBY76707.1 hypothetical protein [Cyanobacteria bacterium UBA11148]